MTPTTKAAELPEALRVPLDSLHADAGYLCGRLLNGSLTQEQVVESIRRRIDAAKLAALTAQATAAQAARPVALLVRKNSWRDGQWEAAPPNSPSYGREWASQRVYVYTTPQPTHAQAGAVPLTPERVKEIVRGAGYDQCGIPDTERAAFINGLRHGEREHGIKGGQHVS